MILLKTLVLGLLVFLQVSGKEGGMAWEISKSGIQLLTLINLYEDGLLKNLKMISEGVVEYEIHEDYKRMSCTEEEKEFLEILSKQIGMRGRLEEDMGTKSITDGSINLNDIWFDFWHTYLHKLTISRGYTAKEGVLTIILSVFVASLIFGAFVSVFLSFIPYIGTYIAGLFLSPVLILFAFGYWVAGIILANFDIAWISYMNVQSLVLFVTAVSWFAWFVILGQSMPMLNRKLTPQGLEVVRKIEGYKRYLKSVDKSRLSFSFNRDVDFSRNRTSFSLLGIFGLVTDKQWDQWYEATGLQKEGKE